MPANNRIYYASQAVQLLPCNSDLTAHYSDWVVPQGLQSVGMTTNFNLEQVFQLGQLELYDNLEGVPEVEVTLNKVLDGTPPLYLICTNGSTSFPASNGYYAAPPVSAQTFQLIIAAALLSAAADAREQQLGARGCQC